jgi:DNA-binding transcriptional MerR regulator
MKNWLTIGEFSTQTSLTRKALRLYDEMGLLVSHARGENGYRYYHTDQLELARRLLQFKDLGFSLLEIQSLLNTDAKAESFAKKLKNRLGLISQQEVALANQRSQILDILSSLESKTGPLRPPQRRAIMSFYGQVSIVLTGDGNLERSAEFIRQHFSRAGAEAPIVHWGNGDWTRIPKPYIIILPPHMVVDKSLQELHPDVVVICGFNEHSLQNQEFYLQLYSEVGPHMNTVINAEDRAAIDFASQALVKKGRIFYFTKNEGLESQISKIGGIVSDGEHVKIYGFNLGSELIHFELGKIMSYSEESAYLASLGAVMTLGLKPEFLRDMAFPK